MKIPLKFKYKERLMPNILITILGQRTNQPILAVIDTGAEDTILSYKDALALQIPIKNMNIVKNIQGVSRQKVGLYEYKKPLRLFLRKEDETILSINLDKIFISSDSQGANITIIGTNFLKNNNFRLFYDPNGEAYLEKNEEE